MDSFKDKQTELSRSAEEAGEEWKALLSMSKSNLKPFLA